MIYFVGDASAVFDLGDALLRVKKRHPWRDVTPEPTTLQWLADRELSFPVPRTLHYTEDVDRTYHIVTRVPGESIDIAWRSLDDEQEERCIARVTEICQELSKWTSDTIAGVDGNQLFDPWIDIGSGRNADLSSQNSLWIFQQLGMDTSTFVFSHNDIGPTNVLIDVNNDCAVGVVDWEMAGFVPLAWVGTKPAACRAMYFCWNGIDLYDSSMREWRVRLAAALERHGEPQVADSSRSWYNERRGQ